MQGDLKITFQLQMLHKYNQRVVDAMQATMQRLGVNDTGDGAKSIAYKALQLGGNTTISNLSFKEYLRFVDMGVGKGNPLGGLKTVRKTLQASRKQGLAFVNKKRKPKKIYSKIAYGKVNELIGDLLYGYTEETIAQLKKQFA
jgi:hypothetical protein